MSSAAFGIFAAILILCALAASFGRSVRVSAISMGACATAVVAMFVVQSSYLLAAGAFVIVVAFAEITRREVARKRSHLVNVEARSRWLLFAAIPAIAGAALAIVVAVAGGWHQGLSTASLLTIFHYRYPIVGLIAIAGIVAALGSARVNLNVQKDEETHHQTRADKASQAERMARRRADREADRQRRRERRAPG